MPLTRAKKFPYYMLIHDKHRGAHAHIFYLYEGRVPWLPYLMRNQAGEVREFYYFIIF